jgi:hypothetical protein
MVRRTRLFALHGRPCVYSARPNHRHTLAVCKLCREDEYQNDGVLHFERDTESEGRKREFLINCRSERFEELA